LDGGSHAQGKQGRVVGNICFAEALGRWEGVCGRQRFEQAGKHLFPCHQNEFFQFDIIGLKVIENGEILGIVEDIQDNFANSLLYIKTDEELTLGGKPNNFYIPYLEHFIISVNLNSGEILVKGARAILENS